MRQFFVIGDLSCFAANFTDNRLAIESTIPSQLLEASQKIKEGPTQAVVRQLGRVRRRILGLAIVD